MQVPRLPRREALQQASASCRKWSQDRSGAYAEGHHVGVVKFGEMSDMLGRKLRWGGKQRLDYIRMQSSSPRH